MASSTHQRFAVFAIAAGAVFGLVGCSAEVPVADTSASAQETQGATGSPEGAGGFCEVLLTDTSTAAVVFAAPIWGSSGLDQDNIAKRIQLLDQLETVPPELADDLEIWRGFLDTLGDVQDPAEVFAAQTDEVEAAGDALFEEYTSACL